MANIWGKRGYGEENMTCRIDGMCMYVRLAKRVLTLNQLPFTPKFWFEFGNLMFCLLTFYLLFKSQCVIWKYIAYDIELSNSNSEKCSTDVMCSMLIRVGLQLVFVPLYCPRADRLPDGSFAYSSCTVAVSGMCFTYPAQLS